MNVLFNHPVLAALSVALFHSLWIFVVVALAAELIARATNTARVKYRIYLIALFGGALVFGAIWGVEIFVKTEAWEDAVLLSERLGTATALSLTDGLELLEVRTATDWSSFFSKAYLIGLFFALGRYAWQYVNTRRLRTGGLLPPPPERVLFARLCDELLPDSRVEWRITDRITTVLVVGVLRPVILFPVGLLNTLTPGEVEAILRHELTHLLRRDPLWNVLQELVKTIFFYHPAVYWLCSRIDREREYACDDAVSASYDKKTYVRALLRAAKYSINPKTPLTMAATETTNFTQRIQRLFTPSAPSQTSGWRSLLIATFAFLPLFGLFALSPLELPELTAVPSTTESKEVVISGTVTDIVTETPLIGTSIVIKGTSVGTITDFDGNFKLSVPEGKLTLLISYVGYQTLEVEVKALAESHLDVRLSKGPSGSVTTTETTVSVKSQPGQTNNSKVRGSTSALQLGERDELLVIVDGEQIKSGSLDGILPENIKSINVVKAKEEIEKLGFGTDFEGALIITTKKKE